MNSLIDLILSLKYEYRKILYVNFYYKKQWIYALKCK